MQYNVGQAGAAKYNVIICKAAEDKEEQMYIEIN